MNFIDHLLFYMKLLNYLHDLFCIMFESVLECVEKKLGFIKEFALIVF